MSHFETISGRVGIKLNRRANLISIVGLLIVGILLTLYNNCGIQRIGIQRVDSPSVTSVGNPMDEQARTLSTRVCQKLAGCHSGLTTQTCEAGLGATPNIVESLGVLPGTLSTLNNLIVAETNRLVLADSALATACGDSVAQLTCQDPLIQNAYTPTSGAPFRGVADLFQSQPTICGNSFTCVGNCQTPSPVGSPTLSPALSPSPLPSPDPSGAPVVPTWCSYDLSTLTPGQSYNCALHGLPSENIFHDIRFQTDSPVIYYVDSSCTVEATPGSSYRIRYQTSQATGSVPSGGYLAGAGFALIEISQSYACVELPNSSPVRYFSMPTSASAWASGTCVWQSTAPGGCPP